jgi:hypothetical protein
MKPTAKKSVSMRAIGVAFTGAAAWATFAAPPAMAAAGPATHHPTVKDLPHDVWGPAYCGSGHRSHWFHLGQDKEASTCIGDVGTWHLSQVSGQATSFCGGNNIGWLKGHYYDGGTYTTHFHQGTTYAHIPDATSRNPLIVSEVHISRWRYNDRCPAA